uniref:UDP-glucuronosyltransferase 2A1-like n=1 Tax=Salmo trutta TaxID=8032 RepID=A0A673XA69_SALTR
TEGSHWINLKPVLETLIDRGHNVTVLVNSASLCMDPTERSLSVEALEDCLEEFIHFSMYEMDHLYYWQIHWRLYELIQRQIQLNMQIVDGLLKSESVMERLREAKYELLLADPIWPGSELVAEMLGLPLVYTFLYPSGPPSYVPSAMPTTTCAMIGNADLWLIRTYWDFEYPRPFLPNFKFVGGIHCKTAKLLPEALEELVQSSGDHGVVVFTLGSMIRNMTTEQADRIASALGQIPQKILWRHSGEKPETLAPNTSHPKTRAFITHDGTNGIYEAIYNGVPIVGIPMFADQPDNMIHMKAKRAAVIMDFNSMQTRELVDGLNAVINNPSYRENTKRLSRIHHDRPISPKDEALFWLEFTMRNRGDRLLRVQAHQLTWYQYHSLDVLALLLAVLLLLTLLFIKSGLFCIRSCFYETKFKSTAE